MSKHTRTSRRRRVALGLGATGGGLLAVAFMPMGIALATPGDAASLAGDPGLASGGDFETTPDPFNDFTGASESSPLSLFDQQLNADNPALAAQLDYDINHGEAFSFSGLDGIPAQTAAFTDADTGTTDLDPFKDALPLNASPTEITNATSYDYALNQVLGSTETGHLDAIVDNPAGSVLIPPTVVPDNDPAADFVQVFDHNAFANPAFPDTPTDFLGQLATLDDQFLNAFGLGGPLDQFEDLFTHGFSTAVDPLGGLGGTTADLLTGATGTGSDALTGLGSTGADFFTNTLADLAGFL